MRHLLLIPALAAALVLAACDGPAEFSAPLSAPGSAPYDARLIGRWYAMDDDDNGIATLVIKAGEEGVLDSAFGYMSVEPGAEGDAGLAWFNRAAHASVIDGQTYYNTRLIDGGIISKAAGGELKTEGEAMFAPHPELGYWIMRADIGPDETLVLRVLTENAPADAGHAGREVDCGEDCEFKIFDLAPAEMAELIRTTKPEDLFRIRIPFARFGSPPPPPPPE